MRVLLEAGTDLCNPDISSELAGPCFEANALRIEASESTFYLQLHFDYYASGPLVQQDSPTRTVLDTTQSFNVVFSSDRSSDRFTGKPVSQTTGLYYEYHRWYDPSTGRFISKDPFPGIVSDPQSLNGYTYASDSPTTYSDPTGLAFICSACGPPPCPSFWKDPFGSFSCGLSRTPTPVADVVAGYDLAVEGLDWAYSELSGGGEATAAGDVTAGAKAGTGVTTTTSTGGITVTTDTTRIATTNLRVATSELSSDVGETQSIQLSQHALDRLPRIVSAFNLVDKGEALDLVKSVVTGGALNPAESEGSVLAYEGVFPGIVRGAPEVMRPLGLRVLYDIENEIVTTAYPFRIPWWPEFF